MLSRRLLLSVVAGASFGIPASANASQPYPQRPVKIITAGLPATTFDLVARALADQLGRELLRNHLAELDAPLVERVDPPDRSLREHAVLVQTDERPE